MYSSYKKFQAMISNQKHNQLLPGQPLSQAMISNQKHNQLLFGQPLLYNLDVTIEPVNLR